jgi:phosphoglycolate phosphatase-like HAD superfamily hydrolase
MTQPRAASSTRLEHPPGRRFDAVILDVDGTLVDSNDAHARAWAEVLHEAGYDVSVERLRRLIGMGSDKLLPAAAGIEKDSPMGKQLSERRKEVFRERYLPRLSPTRGASELLDHLRREDFELMIASSAEGDELKSLLAVCNATDLAPRTPPPSEVGESKPAPDVVQAAVDKLTTPKAASVMLGDTPYDVESARKAGVSVVALRSGGWTDADLRGALAVYADPADLLAHFADVFGDTSRP